MLSATLSPKSGIKILFFLIVLTGLAFSKTGDSERKRPYCEIDSVQKTLKEGKTVYLTELRVYSHKKYWWMKTAGVKDSPHQRICEEDKSTGRKNSRALLDEIIVMYPDMKGENGVFQVKIIPSAAFSDVKDLPACTYNANLFYRHGTTDFKIKGTFHINTGVEPVPPPSEISTEPAKPSVKTQPPKVFSPKDYQEPKEVTISEESKVALAQPIKKKSPSPSLTKASSNFKQGMGAFNKKDYSKAISYFQQIPAPKTRQRGAPTREDYVKGNYYKGMAAQKLGKIKDAIASYKLVLSYEKYFPLVQMNMGICFMELKQYAKAHSSFQKVIRDQNRIPPELYDDVMQRSRYFWAVTWTRLYRSESQVDRKAYYKRQAYTKWKEYKSWFGNEPKYAKANEKAESFLSSLE